MQERKEPPPGFELPGANPCTWLLARRWLCGVSCAGALVGASGQHGQEAMQAEHSFEDMFLNVQQENKLKDRAKDNHLPQNNTLNYRNTD